MKISKHFSLKEFTRSASVPGHVVKPTYYQLKQIKDICDNVLEPIRGYAVKKFSLTGRAASMKINSGMRDGHIFETLTKAGFDPSPTSDHFFQSVINPIGRGAADFTFPNAGLLDRDFLRIYNFIQCDLRKFVNQAIYYRGRYFIHVGLHPSFTFNHVRTSSKRFFIRT